MRDRKYWEARFNKTETAHNLTEEVESGDISDGEYRNLYEEGLREYIQDVQWMQRNKKHKSPEARILGDKYLKTSKSMSSNYHKRSVKFKRSGATDRK